ncbi:MAG: hypothetical protein KGI19_04905 [Thaumarchaeota archaeon]|nr:hypothetical protein [Nitrososphaerota archaeon]
MKKLIYYISDIGRGHATRSVAIIRELQKKNIEVVMRNSNVVNFLKQSLPKAQIIEGLTDVGPSITSGGMFMDQVKTQQNVTKWIDEMNTFAEIEHERILKISPDLIITDISPMPLLTAKKVNKSSIAISNFSWYDVSKFLPEDKLEFLKNAYDNADLAIQLPIGSDMEHFKKKKKVGMVARIPVRSRHETRRRLGIGDDDHAVLFAMGGNEITIKCKTDKNVKILTMNATVENVNDIINLSDYPEGQDVVAASDLVICKCGYGMASECLTNGIPFRYFVSNNPIEQIQAAYLKKHKFGTSISDEELKELDLTCNSLNSIPPIIKEPLGTDQVIEYISEFLRN